MLTDYAQWQSDLTPEQVFKTGEQLRYPHPLGQGVVYLTTQPDHADEGQSARTVLMYRDGDTTQCLTPPPFSLRTRINEYGGKPFWLHGDCLVFANDVDQVLYLQELSVAGSGNTPIACSRPRALTQSNPPQLRMFSDVSPLGEGLWLALMEIDRHAEQSENQTCIVVVDQYQPDSEPQVLAHGADFYSNLCLDEDTSTAAWVQWQHPDMPWDNTELCYTRYRIDRQSRGVEFGARHSPDLQQPVSVCQLMFAGRGRLLFSADFGLPDSALPNDGRHADVGRDFWNLWLLDTSIAAHEPQQLSALAVEFGYPHWQYGDARIARLDENRVITIGSEPEADRLYVLDLRNLELHCLDMNMQAQFQDLVSGGQGRALMMCLDVAAPPAIQAVSVDADNSVSIDTIYQSASVLETDDISIAKHCRFATRDGDFAWGFYYPPCNKRYRVKADNPPPLLVMVHGGPTARAYGHFDLQKQFWTQHGFAVLDVNHRGSSGYGRAYRDALLEGWGELDSSDIVDAIAGLVDQELVDARRVYVRGKSAGGYAVLRVLTEYPDIFRAGACYYGIGNLATLAEITHKFEKHYTDRLIGECYDPDQAKKQASRFYQRSPIHRLDQLASAMIVFQGGEDKVVPPALAHEIIEVLERRRIKHSYVEYPDEGHGFRQAANNIDAWQRELAFFRATAAQSQ